MDKTDNMTADQDLLDILSGGLGVEEDNTSTVVADDNPSELEKALSGTPSDEEDEKDADSKLAELKEIADKLTMSTTGKNPGSGDIDTDLSNWFDGKDALPSDSLNDYVSNASLKMDYGLSKNVISSYAFMGKLRKFIEEDAFDVLFSEQAILGCDPEDVESRLRTAFTMYEKLASLNAKVINDIKNYRLKSNTESTDIDRLTLLLGSIPSDKLTKILEEISYSTTNGGTN